MLFLTISFLVTAFIYASVGFGGGSTYNALLVLAEVDYKILPIVALTCNLLVVSSGCYRFYRAGYLDLKAMLPWGLASVPAALIGGYIHVSEIFFIGLLAASLFISGLWMLKPVAQLQCSKQETNNRSPFIAGVFGALLGLIAGIVGIGGGIFLAPLLYALNWAKERQIAATCSMFILINSIAGLLGHFMKMPATSFLNIIEEYAALCIAVIIGGQLGAMLGACYLPARWVKNCTAILILYVAIRLFWRLMTVV